MYCGKCGTSNSESDQFCIKCGAALGAPATPTAGPGTPAGAQLPVGEAPYSGFWRRFAAYVLDYLIVSIPSYMLAGVLLALVKRPAMFGVAYAVVFLAYWLYAALMWSSSLQATIGKLALDLKVTDYAGQRISFGRATGRYFAQILTAFTLGVGYALVVFTRKRQALHDMIADTLIVRRDFAPEEIAAAPDAPRRSALVATLTVIAVVFFNPMGIGILAAIAIPAYQAYTIRAQVNEGLMLAGAYKAAIAEKLANGEDPQRITTDALGLPTPDGAHFVNRIEVVRGAIVIEYGREANKNIASKTLVITPGVALNGDIIWVCGSAAAPEGLALTVPSGAKYTTVGPQYLPASCHR